MSPPSHGKPRRRFDGENVRQKFTFLPLEPSKGESVGRREAADEDQFVESVREDVDFVKLCIKYQDAFRIPEQVVVGFASEACRIGWSVARRLLTSRGPLAEAEAELRRVKQRLVKCNLVATQDIEAVKIQAEKNVDALKLQASGKRAATETVTDEEDLDAVTFHEPLQFLDGDTRELVLAIVRQKMRLLRSGKAPASFMQELMREDVDTDDDPEEGTQVDTQDLQDEVEDLSKRLEGAKYKAEEAMKAAQLAHEQLREAEAAMQRLVAMEAALRNREAHLDAENARLQQEVEKAKQDALEAAERALTSERRIQEIAEELADSRAIAGETDVVRELPRSTSTMASPVAKQAVQPTVFFEGAPSVPSEFGGTRTSWAAASRTSWTASRSSWRKDPSSPSRKNKRRAAVSVQTDMTGSDFDEQAAENKRLHVVVLELQQKLKELMELCRKRGIGGAVEDMFGSLGLNDVLKPRTVFDRLYEDAMDRISRLEDLRARVNRERTDLRPHIPESLSDLIPGSMNVEPSILTMVEQTRLKGFNQLGQTSSLARPNEAVPRAAALASPVSPAAVLSQASPGAVSGRADGHPLMPTVSLAQAARRQPAALARSFSSPEPPAPASTKGSPAPPQPQPQQMSHTRRRRVEFRGDEGSMPLLQSRALVASKSAGSLPDIPEDGRRGYPLQCQDEKGLATVGHRAAAIQGQAAPSMLAAPHAAASSGRRPLAASLGYSSLPSLPAADRGAGAEAHASASAASRVAGRWPMRA